VAPPHAREAEIAGADIGDPDAGHETDLTRTNAIQGAFGVAGMADPATGRIEPPLQVGERPVPEIRLARDHPAIAGDEARGGCHARVHLVPYADYGMASQLHNSCQIIAS
jgi:hypothetical protein